MAENKIITTDLKKSDPGALIELFELKLSEDTTLYFHPGTDDNYSDIQFDGETYVALPLIIEGLEIQGDGATARPTITIANVTNVFKTALNDNEFKISELVGSRFTRRRTLARYLTGGVDEATPFEFPVSTYIIDRIASENSVAVEFELASPFDVEGVKIPARNVIGRYCTWMYQGRDIKNRGGCSWLADSKVQIGDTEYLAYFDEKDRPLVPNSTSSSFSSWSAGSYGKDVLKSHSSKYWMSKTTANTEEPGTGSLWQEILLYSTWGTANSYSAGNLVQHTITINNISVPTVWKCTIDVTNPSPEPKLSSPYWIKAEQCSKKLSGCKSRFQYLPNTNDNSVPSSAVNTRTTLPFGAFPGSVKFK
jgi:lambda family phage minor tail protein L